MYRPLRIAVIIWVSILIFWITASYAQSGSFTFVNEGNVEIDRAAVEKAAQLLIDQYGADVAVYAVVTGNKQDFTVRLSADGLISTFNNTRQRTLAIYIATEERYSEIRWGSEFDKIDGGNIRSDALNPALRNREFTQAFVNTLQAVDEHMSNPFAGIMSFLGQVLSEPAFWMFVGLLLFAYISKKMGFSGGGNSSYDYSNDSSWSSSDSGGSSSDSGDSGGGSDGGSWDD